MQVEREGREVFLVLANNVRPQLYPRNAGLGSPIAVVVPNISVVDLCAFPHHHRTIHLQCAATSCASSGQPEIAVHHNLHDRTKIQHLSQRT